MKRLLPSALFLVLAALLLSPAVVAQKPALPSDLPIDAPACASQPASSVFVPVEAASQLLFYAVPAGALQAGPSRIGIEVSSDRQPLLVEELAVDASVLAADPGREYVVLEFLATDARYRQRLFELLEDRDHALEVEVTVDAETLLRTSLADFVANSEDVKRMGILPTAAGISSRQVTIAEGPGKHLKFVICGDNVCSPGTFPNGEDCEICPQDCGGSCTICGNNFCGPSETCQSCSADCGQCPSCPTQLPSQTVTELIGLQTLGYSCFTDVIFPSQSSYYAYTRLDYKRYTLLRVRECDGSITVTIDPGSIVYFSSYCYRYLGWYCGSFPTFYPWCYFF